MLPLHERLQGVVDILNRSNQELASPKAHETGYVAVPPKLLAEVIEKLVETTDMAKVSLDLGCGNGGWILLAAAAGFPSYGIEINHFLIDHLQRNYELAIAAGFIDPTTPCTWIIGDMIPVAFNKRYMAFRKLHELQKRTMPIAAVVEDSYDRLPITVATADIIYCWSWPTQSRFVFNMLQDTAKKGAVFVLPSYEQYINDMTKETSGKNTLLLTPLVLVKNVFMGRRK